MGSKEKKSSKTETESSPVEPTPSSKRKAEVDEIEVDLALPEPPSKKARRALKKGKVLPAKPDSDDENKDGDKKEKKEKVRSEHSVWIGNLRFTVTPAELRQWLVDNSGGVISDEAMTRVKLPTQKDPSRDKNTKAPNKGFAYVDFTDINSKVAAIALSETEWFGRKLLIKDATSFEGRPKKDPEAEAADGVDGKTEAETTKDANASRKVFVGNMSFKTTDDDLWRNFEKCGEIEWVKVATFEDTGKCKGFGWVKFKEPEAAAWAVKGFVKIKEAVETEDDFKAPEDKDEEEAPQQKQFKMRKWWVNRMLGRELKVELAEDDQVRYKKRFGKDKPRDEDNSRRPQRKNWRDGNTENGDSGPAGGKDRPLKEATDISVARLTGAVVKHTGTKMTFD
ncbi:Fc.00g098540.m01.CDS01 [Cosmosporella sp. VM-42]